jgi:hypothetical protein
VIDVSDRFAEGFLRAGGRLALAEWMGLTAEAQEAFVAAGDRIRVETVEAFFAQLPALGAQLEDARAGSVLERGVAKAAERLTKAAGAKP